MSSLLLALNLFKLNFIIIIQIVKLNFLILNIVAHYIIFVLWLMETKRINYANHMINYILNQIAFNRVI